MRQKYFALKWFHFPKIFVGTSTSIRRYCTRDGFNAFTGVNNTVMLVNKDDKWYLTFCKRTRTRGFGSYHNEYYHYILDASKIAEIMSLEGTFVITNKEIDKLKNINNKLVQDVLKALSVMVL